MSWTAAGVGAAAGLALGPPAHLLCDLAARRRALDPRPLPGRLVLLCVALAAACAGCAARFDTAAAVVAGGFCAACVLLATIDLEHRVVPNEIVLPAAAAVLAARTAVDPGPQWTIAAAAAAGFLLVTALVYPTGIGMGDVKLGLLVGAGLGRTTLLGLLLGFGATLPVTVALLVRHGRRARGVGIPFVPFLAAGAVAALFAWPPS